ncbi:phage terminase small subunit P27 family [Paenibacillus ginsengihumi]|uniref:phage terminase small subunit P27 family n=1 Tax=Paenibacillus ginsengihumi TaxID=431596 RepID=UPI0003615350|nr:phage terminase small subunit P27 family [Paenibacillus ginsengihumi]
MAGRKAYPVELMVLTNDNNRLTKKDIESRRKNEPNIDSAKLRCPAHLSPEAKKEWRRIVKLYRELDKPIVTDLDVNALEIYCEALVTYRKAMEKVRETSEVYVSRSDNRVRKNPWLTVANEAAVQMKKYGEVLLLDPVSRARAGMVKSDNEKKSPMAQFLNRRGAHGS